MDFIFDGITFDSEAAMHEYRLIFDFDYFSDCAEQNYPNI